MQSLAAEACEVRSRGDEVQYDFGGALAFVFGAIVSMPVVGGVVGFLFRVLVLLVLQD
jgi:hypothetical protein